MTLDGAFARQPTNTRRLPNAYIAQRLSLRICCHVPYLSSLSEGKPLLPFAREDHPPRMPGIPSYVETQA